MTACIDLFGVWKLLSAQFVFDDTAEIVNVHGPDPDGVIVLGPDGYMVGLITPGAKAQRANQNPAALFRAMLAYSGRYRVEGEQLITAVDIAWHPSWVGTEQARFFRIDGDRLFITTPPQTLPLYGKRLGRFILMWRRA